MVAILSLPSPSYVLAVLTGRTLRTSDSATLRRAAELATPRGRVVLVFVDELARRAVPTDARRAWAFVELAVAELSARSGLERHATLAALAAAHPGAGAAVLGDPFDAGAARALRRAMPALAAVETVNDVSLLDPGSVRYYKVFSAFERHVRGVLDAARGPFAPSPRPPVPAPAPEPGVRTEGLRLLARARRIAADGSYARFRDTPASDRGATRLGPYLARGVVGAREAWAALGRSELGSQLLWREFYLHLAHWFGGAGDLARRAWRPDRAHADDPRWAGWRNDAREWRAFREGRTGVPIVDAGVRQLLATGWMHNRARMIVAQYLVKDLMVDWRRGERWFRRHLEDFDASNNAGNWQWNAGTGTDPEPFGRPRVFNPWRQAERHDPRAEYIRRWVPELRGRTAREIHAGHAAGRAADHAARRDAYLAAMVIRRRDPPKSSG